MSAPVDVLADLRILANIGDYRDLRESMEKCLRPHERAGFADLLARMGDNHTAVAELIEATQRLHDRAEFESFGRDASAEVEAVGAALARVKGGAA